MKATTPFVISVIVLFSFVGSLRAQRALTEIPNPDPAYQLSKMQAAEGFEINLFAAEPMIAKPTSMAFDGKGRLYVTCTPIYPQIEPGKLPSDQVIRLEDTDGDGVADKQTVFADGLLIPTAVLPTPGGVYVTNSTELLFFEDKDDDGVADSRRVVFSGFGTEDTHHIIHTLRYGPAGRIYWIQSIYTHSHVETPYGYRDLQAGGVWQLRPETLELEVYARGMWNSWGLQFDRWGQSFQSDGAGFAGIGYSFPGAAFTQSVGYDRVLENLNPGQPKFCGLEIINGNHFPDSWQGRIITNDFRGNRISTFEVTDSNSGYISQKREDLVTSTHGAFRPIDLQNGPDGALYVADWYNPIIQHGEVDFRDERRDKVHGRIWRITAKDRPLSRSPDFASASVERLLGYLKSVEAFVRDHAKRELKHRGADTVLPVLSQWIKDLNHSHPSYEEFLLEALWLSHSLDAIHPHALEALLDSDNFKMRAAALRVLEERPAQYPTIMSRLAKAVADEAPRVRNEAIQILRKLATEEAAQLVVQVLDLPMDENLDFSLWNAMRKLQPVWLPQARNDPHFFGDNLSYLFYAIRSVQVEEAIQPLERLWKEGNVPPEYQAEALELLAERGNAAMLAEVLGAAIQLAESDRSGGSRVLAALGQAASQRQVIPSGNLEGFIPLFQNSSQSVQSAAIRLAGLWKLSPAVPELRALLEGDRAKEELLNAAVGALVGIGSREALGTLSELAESELPLSTRMTVAAGYATAEPDRAVELVVKLLESLGEQDDGSALVVPYITKKEGPGVLADALASAQINTQVATQSLRRVSTASIDTSALQAALQKAGGIEPVNMILSEEEMAEMVQFVESEGDPVRGEWVYRRENLLCMTCHAIGGSGGSLGPDLTSIGASAPVDYLIDSMLQPGKQIKEGFHVIMVTKKDGTVAAGKLAFENETTITLQDPADQMIEIPKSEVQSREMSPVSLMPPGLTASLRKDEFADLIKFMSRLGKEGDFNVGPERFVRTFRYLDDNDGDQGYADMVRHKPMVFVTSDDPRMIWLPGYAMTSGVIPLQELSQLRRQGKENYHYLKFNLDVKSAGDAILSFNSSEELRVFVGEQEVEVVTDRTPVRLEQGVQPILVAAHAWKRQDKTLRIEVLDAADDSAQFQVVYGK